MNLIKVAAAVLNTTPLDWAGNQRTILAAIAEAKRQNVSILCLPEMCVCGYGCEDAFHSPGTARTAWQSLMEILPHTAGIAVSLGLPVIHHNGIFNCAAMCADGRQLGLVAKRYLAGDGIHYEPRWFKPWPTGIISEITPPTPDENSTFNVQSQSAAPSSLTPTRPSSSQAHPSPLPIGDLYFDLSGVRVGFEICEDAWVAKRPGGELALEGVDIILNPSASHFAFGKLEVRKRFVIEGSRAFGVTYVYSNLLGNEAGRAIYDGGALIASGGKLLAVGPRFSFADFHVTTAVVDIDANRMTQARTVSFIPTVSGGSRSRVAAEFEHPKVSPEIPATSLPAWETGPSIKEEEFTRAEALALWDYLRKSRSAGFVVSLSGGADSAACAVLVSCMAHLAVAELGIPGALSRLCYLSHLRAGVPHAGPATPQPASDPSSLTTHPSPLTPHHLVRHLLSCVYQSTENSGPVTFNAAKSVAEAVGAEFYHFDVDPLVKGYIAMISKALGRPLTWERDDIALQNIQARVRSPGVWMLTNIKGALLLSTSNRSEAAVGYATMDGDTSGGLSPLAGIDKNFLRHWLRWFESSGPAGLSPLPALRFVNEQAPTAELRPASSHQTDEDDLMPYDVLDAVERLAIRDKRSPVECLRFMLQPFSRYTPRQLAAWVERFFKLWCRNQWKRERYAPSFHLDDENLDPKTWCRFPILSGGYERELAELRQYVNSLT